MRFTDLIQEMQFEVHTDHTNGELEILGLTADSRCVESGYLFAALPGSAVDGRRFVEDALARDAAAILVESGTDVNAFSRPVSILLDDNPRRAFSRIASRFYGRQPHHVAAVTGTNGKSSVAEFVRQIWSAAGLGAASMGTLGVTSPHGHKTGSLTTPDPATLHATLRELAVDGVTHLALEASSHGLDQYRLDGVEIATGAFTNLSRDHLDYHSNMEAYLEAKLGLFSRVMSPGGTAVINVDDRCADAVIEVAQAHRHRLVRYGVRGDEIKLKERRPEAGGQQLSVNLFDHHHDIHLPLVGGFQAANAICALGIAISDGIDEKAGVAALGQLSGVRGRLEHISSTSDIGIYVDYAHTPDALETVLRSLRPHTQGRLIAVFGCGGDRDVGKRQQMGAVASAQADLVFVTDDNPRTEDAAAIRQQIMLGCPDANEIGDRRQAIAAALDAAVMGDVVVVAGKGHEQGQIIGDQVLPFDDGAVVRDFLNRGQP